MTECCHHHRVGPRCLLKASARHRAARGDRGRASSPGGELGYPGRPDGRVSDRHGMHHAARRSAAPPPSSRPTPAAFSSCKVPEPRERTMHQIRFRPAPWPRPMYMQKSAFNCFKSCADSQAPFSGIADARRRGRPRAPHADLAILRWLPPNPGWGGIE